MSWSMTVYAGYLLTTHQAAEFARLRYPDLTLSAGRIVDAFRADGFITDYVYRREHARTRASCLSAMETEKCKKLKERLISPYVDQLPWLEDIVFDSVPDPRMQIMDALRDWRIRQEYYQRKRAQQFGDSEEDDTSEPSTPTQPQANPLPA